MPKVTISLEEDILQFVDQYAQGNRSAYINTLLAEHRRRILSLVGVLESEYWEFIRTALNVVLGFVA